MSNMLLEALDAHHTSFYLLVVSIVLIPILLAIIIVMFLKFSKRFPADKSEAKEDPKNPIFPDKE